jgi:hypothetical protein
MSAYDPKRTLSLMDTIAPEDRRRHRKPLDATPRDGVVALALSSTGEDGRSNFPLAVKVVHVVEGACQARRVERHFRRREESRGAQS